MMKIYCAAFALFVMLAACKADKEGRSNMSMKGEQKMTHCIGRSLIDLPSSFAEASVTTGIFKLEEFDATGESIDVVVHNEAFTIDRFEKEVQKRRVELNKTHIDAMNVLRLDRRLNDGSNLFRVQEIDDAYVSEVHMLRGSSMVTVRLESYHEKYLEAEEALLKLIAQIRPIDTNSSSKKNTGFCLGTVTLTSSFSLESGSFLFRDGKGSNYGVEIDTYAKDGKTPLLTRMSGSNSLLALFDVKHRVLRARERTVAGMQAQEWLGWAKVSDEPEAKTLKFALDSMRSKPSRTAPRISLEFETAQPLEDGTPTRTVVSDNEAMQQWDTVVDSIRPAGV